MKEITMETDLEGQEQPQDEGKNGSQGTPSDAELVVTITPFGPRQSLLNTAGQVALKHPSVQRYLKGTRHRLLSIEALTTEPETKTSDQPLHADRYLATVYDYTHNRTLLIRGVLSNQEVLEVEESYLQPFPSAEEFEAAVRIIEKQNHFALAMQKNHLLAVPAMPPFVEEELPDGSRERTLTIGLIPTVKQYQHEVVGVNMVHQRVSRFQGRAPQTSRAADTLCGVPAGNTTWVSKGTPGQANVTVTQGNTVLWTFQLYRPAASSGTNGSGAELRLVNYRGKSVLCRAHVPILNVQYDNNACGPYRDWQWSEHVFQADGTDHAPGIRFCTTPPQTIVDSGSDTGNFSGVAIYVQGLEVVVVSEMQAGWYRYISEWRLHADGTILPRFRFGAVSNSCVCKLHHHHVYWRLDFDIRTSPDNIVQEYNNPPIIGSSNFSTFNQEVRRLRDASHKRYWQVKNATTGEGYAIIPGANDGKADSFSVGDLWVLRYHNTEFDDGQQTVPANLDKFVNGESVYKQDVVLWYAAHFTHDVHHEDADHVVGPELRPVNWLS
jgi:hypothetical protein